MVDNTISFKLVLNGKEALATLSLTDKELKKLAEPTR